MQHETHTALSHAHSKKQQFSEENVKDFDSRGQGIWAA